jgi:hypothetical protein
MIRFRFRIAYDRRVLVLLLSLPLSLLLAGSVVASDSSARVQGAPTYLVAGGGERHFYLTHAFYAANQPLAACGEGYHMASLWEILDVSNMIYDYDHPDAYHPPPDVTDDSGQGPPSYWNGWVRTGYDASSFGFTGSTNCSNWTSTSSTSLGVAVGLSWDWETAPGDIGPWVATGAECHRVGNVWCVADTGGGGVYLPLILRNFP